MAAGLTPRKHTTPKPAVELDWTIHDEWKIEGHHKLVAGQSVVRIKGIKNKRFRFARAVTRPNGRVWLDFHELAPVASMGTEKVWGARSYRSFPPDRVSHVYQKEDQ